MRTDLLVRVLARVVIIGLALLPAVIYGLVALLEVEHKVEYDTAIQSRRISDFIALNPDSWHYLSERVRDQLAELRHADTRTVVMSTGGDLVARVGDSCRFFCLTEEANLLDYGNVVGRLSVTQNVSGVLLNIGLVSAALLVLGVIVLLFFERYLLAPLVTSNQVNQALRVQDALTRLPNRRYLLDQLEVKLAANSSSEEYGALIMLDIDQFNVINDTEGHLLGDRLLVELANRLAGAVRQGETVARVGGDEFVVVLERLGKDSQEAAQRAERVAVSIRHKLGLPYAFAPKGQVLHVTVSMGVALYGGKEGVAPDLVKEAEIALYEAKRCGRNAVRFFNAGIQAELETRTSVEAALRRGIDNDEFELYYQPQCDDQWQIIGAEALVRWHPQGGGLITPGQFVAVAEESGLILPIGTLILQKACLQIKAWEKTAWSGIQVAVNVSARQFEQNDFVDQLKTILHLTGANPSRLKLEVTESMVINNFEETIERMHALQSLGVSFSLDDFGTGYSSLYVLKRLPLQQIKIDQSFVSNVVSDPNDYAIVRAIIALGQSLGLEVLAEGVETEEQREFLLSFGCRQYQGYLFGRPEPVGEWA